MIFKLTLSILGWVLDKLFWMILGWIVISYLVYHYGSGLENLGYFGINNWTNILCST